MQNPVIQDIRSSQHVGNSFLVTDEKMNTHSHENVNSFDTSFIFYTFAEYKPFLFFPLSCFLCYFRPFERISPLGVPGDMVIIKAETQTENLL